MYIVNNSIYSKLQIKHNYVLKTFGDSLEDSLTVDRLVVTCDNNLFFGVEALN